MFGNQITLGRLIDLLKKTVDSEQPDKRVRYDFAGLPPTTLDSYRGFYDHLALGYGHEVRGPGPTVTELIADLERCIGKTFEGWKGGSYMMDRTTTIWVANRGETGDTTIVGVKDKEYYVVLLTENVDC